MMIIKKIPMIILVFIVLFQNHSFSQRNTSIQGQQTHFNKFASNLDRIKAGEEAEALEGSYLCSEWKDGMIYAKPNVNISDLKLKYCVLNQEFEFINDNDTFSINKPTLVDSIEFDNKCFIYTNYHNSNKIESSYFEVLNSSSYLLLQKYDCKFVRGKKNVSSFEESTKDSYIIYTNFYLKEDYGPAFLLPKSKSAFLNVFGTKKEKIKNFMKANKLKRSNKGDLSKIIAYYYQLNTKP